MWFFVWGVAVLALRIFGGQNTFWFALGLFGIFPLILIAAWSARRQQPAFAKLRANYDRLNSCGGIVMSEETADMAAWFGRLPAAPVSTSTAEPKPAPEKSARPVSAIDALREARERAQKRTDRER